MKDTQTGAVVEERERERERERESMVEMERQEEIRKGWLLVERRGNSLET